MLEPLYRIWFRLASIRPIGALDLALRRWLGRLFNDAASGADLATMRSLASNRQTAIERITGRNLLPGSQLPCIDIVLCSDGHDPKLQAAIDALARQTYPGGNLTLTVLLAGKPAPDEKPDLPGCFRQERFIDSTASEAPSAYTAAPGDVGAPYILFMGVPLVLLEHAVEQLVRHCLCAPGTTGLWEVSPVISQRIWYCDPVSLEIPCSVFECALFKRAAYDAVGGFDPRFPAAGQKLELGYRMRAAGFRLQTVGRPGLIAGSHDGDGLPAHERQDESRRTLWLMRERYGTRLQRALASIRPGRTGDVAWPGSPGAETAARAGNVRPSRLWRGGYEIKLARHAVAQRIPLGEEPLVSIIVRTYAGRLQWLQESVCSVLNQSWPNIELVVVEDGSTEYKAFLLAVEKALQPGQSLQYLAQEKLGKSRSGNLALENARGDYIGFLDDDDLLFPHHVETLLGAAMSDKNAAGACALAWEVQTCTGTGKGYVEEHYEVPRHTRRAYSRAALERHNLWPIQSVLFERRLYERYGGFDVDRVLLEDWELWLRYTQGSYFAQLPLITSLYRTPADPYARLERVGNPSRRAVDN